MLGAARVGIVLSFGCVLMYAARGYSELLLAWTGGAALLFLLVAAGSSIFALHQGRWQWLPKVAGRGAACAGLLHAAAFAAADWAEGPVAPLTSVIEKPFVVPGALGLFALTTYAIGARWWSSRSWFLFYRHRLADGALLLTALHLAAGPEIGAITLGASFACVALVGARNRQPLPMAQSRSIRATSSEAAT